MFLFSSFLFVIVYNSYCVSSNKNGSGVHHYTHHKYEKTELKHESPIRKNKENPC